MRVLSAAGWGSIGKAMGKVELPFVSAVKTVEEALAVMQSFDRSGVVTKLAGKHWVLTDADLVDALRTRGNLRVGEIEPSDLSLEVTQPPEAEEAPKREAHYGTEAAGDVADGLGGIFQGPSEFPLVFEAMIDVITPRESVASRLSTRAVICRCTSDSSHVWRPGQLANGKCAEDGSAVNCG